MIELHQTKKELRKLKSSTKKVHVGECAEGCDELWMCHKYNLNSEFYRCDLCDFHRCDVPCSSVCCSASDRNDEDTVYFTNFK